MRIVEEARNCPAQNNESGQLESQKCLFVIREKTLVTTPCTSNPASQTDVLQLTDFTSEITDEELREFTSEYYIPFALHPVVPAASASVAKISNFEVNCRLLAINPTVHLFRAFYHTSWSNGWVSFSKRAGRLQCYTEKLDALRRWREMFFWVDDALVPWDFAFYTQGSLPRDERPPPGSYSMEDAELINRTVSLSTHTRSLSCHLGISLIISRSPEKCRPFIGDDCPGWVLCPSRTPSLSSQAGDRGGAPLREYVRSRCWKVLARRTMEHYAEQPSVEATSDSSASVTHAGQSPPQTSPLTADDISRRDREIGPQGHLRVYRRMKRFCCLKTQLADAQAEAESSRSHAQKLAEEKMALLVKNNHFAGLDEFRQRVEELLEKQEEKLRKLSIEYDEELYPHMLSAIAERRWLISHGLRLAAMGALESQEVKQSFGDVVKCALARGKAEAVEELHEKKLLTVPAAQVPGYNDNAYEELVAAMEAMKLHATEGAEAQPDYFLKPDVAQLQVPIFACPRDILNPFALEKEIPLKESLEAHAIRLAKKKGVKGKAILCGVGAAHIPRSDGVPVSVATVSPKDSELLGKLEEAGDAAYQVGRYPLGPIALDRSLSSNMSNSILARRQLFAIFDLRGPRASAVAWCTSEYPDRKTLATIDRVLSAILHEPHESRVAHSQLNRSDASDPWL
ncbi:hypothetical protein Tco_0598055 [Tanacetum coccineum]